MLHFLKRRHLCLTLPSQRLSVLCSHKFGSLDVLFMSSHSRSTQDVYLFPPYRIVNIWEEDDILSLPNGGVCATKIANEEMSGIAFVLLQVNQVHEFLSNILALTFLSGVVEKKDDLLTLLAAGSVGDANYR